MSRPHTSSHARRASDRGPHFIFVSVCEGSVTKHTFSTAFQRERLVWRTSHLGALWVALVFALGRPHLEKIKKQMKNQHFISDVITGNEALLRCFSESPPFFPAFPPVWSHTSPASPGASFLTKYRRQGRVQLVHQAATGQRGVCRNVMCRSMISIDVVLKSNSYSYVCQGTRRLA